ncbi:MAG: ATP-binding protein [Candidatus Marinimicrobia bacterium]|nr:ATP-binding protein [Candidatus Neomarinimicrobiota bacterium]MCF7839545.1 ATP-binding protein [Candidatus Neomarinimicrobiota bacterium]
MKSTVSNTPIYSQLTISSDCREMEQVKAFLNDFLREHDFDEAEAEDILVAAQEGVTNAIIHGNNLSVQKCVRLELYLNPSQLKIVVSDNGVGFDMESLADPTDPENRMKSNGRGLMFIRTFMDQVMNQTNGDGHKLVMIRNRV